MMTPHQLDVIRKSQNAALHEIVHGKSRSVHGLNPPKQEVRRDRMMQIAERIANLPEYNSAEMLYELVQANLITFWEMYLLLGKAIRQPEMLEKRYDETLYPNDGDFCGTE